jgi:hypothetical protein
MCGAESGPVTIARRIASLVLVVGVVVGPLSAGRAVAQDVAPGVVVQYVPVPSPELAALVPPGTDARLVTVLWFALNAVGTPYGFGARGPASFDCSGLVDAAYRAAGVVVGPTTVEQRHAGVAVSDATLAEPGDLVFVPGADGTIEEPAHVGIYLGNGLLVQATHTGDVVRVTELSAWVGQIATIRRVLVHTASQMTAVPIVSPATAVVATTVVATAEAIAPAAAGVAGHRPV